MAKPSPKHEEARDHIAEDLIRGVIAEMEQAHFKSDSAPARALVHWANRLNAALAELSRTISNGRWPR